MLYSLACELVKSQLLISFDTQTVCDRQPAITLTIKGATSTFQGRGRSLRHVEGQKKAFDLPLVLQLTQIRILQMKTFKK